MSLPNLSVTHGLRHLAPPRRDQNQCRIHRREGGLSRCEPDTATCSPSPADRLACWLVRAALALYLLPALLIVLLVGAAGILAVDIARLCNRWTGPTAE